jgi:hypothetical protein
MQRRLFRRLPPNVFGRPIADRKRHETILAQTLRLSKPHS